jgi:rubrerythrin
MSEKESSEGTHEIAKVVEKKIQYGENEFSCFACGEKIENNTKICPYCNTPQEKNESILK